MEIERRTRYWRDQDGWNGQTIYRMDSGRLLMIWTGKAGSTAELVTTVTAENPSASGVHFAFNNHTPRDYMKRWAVSEPARLGEAVVQRQHELTLVKIAAIVADITEHYADQGEGD